VELLATPRMARTTTTAAASTKPTTRAIQPQRVNLADAAGSSLWVAAMIARMKATMPKRQPNVVRPETTSRAIVLPLSERGGAYPGGP
jgi:hypothetical protein